MRLPEPAWDERSIEWSPRFSGRVAYPASHDPPGKRHLDQTERLRNRALCEPPVIEYPQYLYRLQNFVRSVPPLRQPEKLDEGSQRSFERETEKPPKSKKAPKPSSSSNRYQESFSPPGLNPER